MMLRWMQGSEDGAATDLSAWARFAVVAAILGIAMRVGLAATTLGTNDIVTWAQFVKMIRELGMLKMYSLETTAYWNHPPLAGYFALMMENLARLTGLPFYFVFKLGPVIADAAVLALLWKFLSPASSRVAALSVAVFALSPDAILVSGFHGNIDSIVGAVVLFSAVELERGHHRRAGVFLGLAINFKLIPLVLVPVLLARSRSDHRVREAAVGLAIGAIPFAILLLADTMGSLWHLAGYSPLFDNWGLAFLVRLADGAVDVLPSSRPYPIAEIVGRVLMLVSAMAVGSLAEGPRKPSPIRLYALGMAAFLVVVPGFGVQWTALVGALIVADSWKWGAAWGLVAGSFIGGIYDSFRVVDSAPVFSWFTSALPVPWVWVGLSAWVLLICFAVTTANAIWDGTPSAAKTPAVPRGGPPSP